MNLIDAIKALKSAGDPVALLAMMEVRRALEGCTSVLDVGCGPDSRLKTWNFNILAGIEGHGAAYEQTRLNGSHRPLLCGDIRHLDRYFSAGQFDACAALDVIEHLPKSDSARLVKAMERVASKRVVLFTPNGFLPQGHTEQDDLQEHLCGWEAHELEVQGYRVLGILGPKRLRGSYHALRGRPKIFWSCASLLGQVLWTRRRPQAAAALLAVKNVRDPGSDVSTRVAPAA